MIGLKLRRKPRISISTSSIKSRRCFPLIRRLISLILAPQKAPHCKQLTYFVGESSENTSVMIKHGMMCLRIKLDLKRSTWSTYGKGIIEKRPLHCLFTPGLIANRWKEAPKAHCRLYPLKVRLSHVLLFVKSTVAQICFEGQY